MVLYSLLLKNFPSFVVIHTVKGFGVVSKAEVDVFLELSLASPCFSCIYAKIYLLCKYMCLNKLGENIALFTHMFIISNALYSLLSIQVSSAIIFLQPTEFILHCISVSV